MELEGAAGFAREGVGIAQIPQISAFATSVTKLARGWRVESPPQ